MTDTKDERIAELERELRKHERGEDEGYQRTLQEMTRLEGEFEVKKRRADALERAVKSALDAWEADEFDEAKYYEIRATLYDQPADAGERPENWVAQEVASAEAEVSKWPAWMTGTADAGEADCCARTREECARVADAYPEHTPFGPDYTAHGLVGSGQNSARRDIAAAIRRTDKDA
jgi:hypothetical protein